MSELELLIFDRIDEAGGWLSFEDYMQLALQEPGLGYYASGKLPVGSKGDFTTAAETSDLFGRALARFVAKALPEDGEILELGGGSGKLMVSVLGELADLGVRPKVKFLETSPVLRKLQEEALSAAGFADHCAWLEGLPESFVGVIFAIEVLDALPCQVFVRRDDGWHERGVIKADGKLSWQDGPALASDLLGKLANFNFPPCYQAELNRQAEALSRSLITSISEGVLLIVDYGFTGSELYTPQRHGGTLTSHYQQQVQPDVLARPGEQDITAHIDFSAVAKAGTAAGGEIEGYCSQQAFLLDLGIMELAEPRREASDIDVYSTSQQLQTLLMPQEMGEIFKVLALGKDVKSRLPGFALGDKSSALLDELS